MRLPNTKIVWINRVGKQLEHTLGARVTYAYANNLFHETIVKCQGILSVDEKRNSQFRLVSITNIK
jgi:hypothetical protein